MAEATEGRLCSLIDRLASLANALAQALDDVRHLWRKLRGNRQRFDVLD
jgi:hypothetical protein